MNINSLTELIGIAKDDSPESRNMLISSLNNICLASGREMSEREKELIYDIVSQLLQAVELHVRQSLAASLADKGDVPHELMLALANDVIDVAYPVITKSKLLEDKDLIQLILEKAEQHQLAVSERPEISEAVSETLVETDNVTVISSLLHNETANIYTDTVDRLVTDSANIAEYQAPLLKRKELQEEMAKRMYQWVGEAMKEHLEFRFSETDMSQELTIAVSDAVQDAYQEMSFDEELEDIIDQYDNRARYRPLPRTLIKALENKDVFHFEELFCDLVDLDAEFVTGLLYDKGPESLAIACKGADLGHQDFSDILCLLKDAMNPENYRSNPEYIRTMDYFDRMDSDGAKKVLSSWRGAAH